jgi:hypothetical protein
MSYEREMKYFSDYVHTVAFAKKQGRMETAKAMLKDGLNPTRVARITKLPKEEILALR